MFLVVALLMAVGERNAAAALSWFGPCLAWIAKWLPLFYVASLVTLPLNLSGIAGGGAGESSVSAHAYPCSATHC